MPASTYRGWRQGAAAVSAIFAALCAAGPAFASPQDTVLEVKALRDAGGVPARFGARLTTALVHFLRDHSEGAFQVAPDPPSPFPDSPGPGRQGGGHAPVSNGASLSPLLARSAARRGRGEVAHGTARGGAGVRSRAAGGAEPARPGQYLLEGEVSFAGGQREDSGRYLVTVRLYRKDTRAALIAQWSGIASSLRYLTANLRHDPTVNTFGLVGEIGGRVVRALIDDDSAPRQRFQRLALKMSSARQDRPEIVGASARAVPRPVSTPGSTFRVRFHTPSTRGTAHLLYAAACGELRQETLEPEQAPGPGRTLQTRPVHLSEDAVEAWVIWRRGNAPNPQVERESLPVSTGNSMRVGASGGHGACLDDNSPPVQVLEGFVGGPALADSTIESLLKEIARDPAGWSVTRIPIASDR